MALVAADLCKDKAARIGADQAARAYFRLGNGKWGRAFYRVHRCDAAGVDRTSYLYTLPNLAEFHQSSFDKSALVTGTGPTSSTTATAEPAQMAAQPPLLPTDPSPSSATTTQTVLDLNNCEQPGSKRQKVEEDTNTDTALGSLS